MKGLACCFRARKHMGSRKNKAAILSLAAPDRKNTKTSQYRYILGLRNAAERDASTSGI